MAKSKSEKRKQIIVLSLFGVMALVVVYQFFFNTTAPKSKSPANRNAPATTAKGGTTITTPEMAERAAARRQSDKQLEQTEIAEMLADISALDLRVIRTSGPATVGQRGNIFDYYIPPPPPPVPITPPPPITVSGLSPQSATAGTPRNFTLTVYGRAFPADAQIIMDGRPRATKRVNETTLSLEMTAADYASPRSMSVEVKSQSEPLKFFSNQITFTASPAPEPPFKYIGLLGDMALLEIPSSKEFIRIQKGGTIKGVWLVDAISQQAIDVTHTQFSIKKRVMMTEKGR